MFAYLINRWAFSRRFEKAESGYIYRRRPDLPGIVLSEDERTETLREFRRQYWKSWLSLLGICFVAVLALALVAMVLDLGESFLTISTFGLILVVLFFAMKSQRNMFAWPEKRFADRPRVDADVGPASWLGRYERLARRRSWLVHAVLVGTYGILSWILVPASLDADMFHWFMFACFILGFALSIYGIVVKARPPND